MTGKNIVLVLVVIAALGGMIILSGNKPKEDTIMEAQMESQPTNMAEPTTAPAMMSNEKRFDIEAGGFYFQPNKITVNVGDKVTFNVKNVGGMHDLVIDELNVKTKLIPANETESITFVADKAGTFEYYCSVTDHRAKGMVGTLVVE